MSLDGDEPGTHSLTLVVRGPGESSQVCGGSRATQLVPIGVREHEPRLVELVTGNRGECSPKLFQAMDLLKEVLDEDVECIRFFADSFGDLLQREGDAAAT